MTELLQSVVDRLNSTGEQGMALTVLEIAARYKGGEATYQQAMLTMTSVVGRDMLVQEVCRLSQITNIPELTSSTGTTTTSTSSPSGGGAHHGAGPTCTMGGAHHGAGPTCTMDGAHHGAGPSCPMGGAHHGAGPTCTMGGAHHGAGPSCTMGGPPTTPMVALRSDSDHQRPGAER